MRNVLQAKCVKPYFQWGPLSEIETIANLRHAANSIRPCVEPEFRLYWRKLCCSDNHCNTAPQCFTIFDSSSFSHWHHQCHHFPWPLKLSIITTSVFFIIQGFVFYYSETKLLFLVVAVVVVAIRIMPREGKKYFFMFSKTLNTLFFYKHKAYKHT